MLRLVILTAVWLLQVVTCNIVPQKACGMAKKDCENSINCAVAYIGFRKECADIMFSPQVAQEASYNVESLQPRIGNCTSRCVMAIRKLQKDQTGKYLNDCNCNLDGYCLTMKAHVNNCLYPNRTGDKRPSCTMANINCSQNTVCAERHERFLADCTHMISGVKCDQNCIEAQENLFEVEVGKNLADCECDGPHEPFCRAIKAHAEQLRCKPGLDGSGRRTFEYDEEETIIYDIENCSSILQNTYLTSWTLLLLLSLLLC